MVNKLEKQTEKHKRKYCAYVVLHVLNVEEEEEPQVEEEEEPAE